MCVKGWRGGNCHPQWLNIGQSKKHRSTYRDAYRPSSQVKVLRLFASIRLWCKEEIREGNGSKHTRVKFCFPLLYRTTVCPPSSSMLIGSCCLSKGRHLLAFPAKKSSNQVIAHLFAALLVTSIEEVDPLPLRFNKSLPDEI